MYGFPPDVDLSFLEGAVLVQVCVGENEIILNLEPNISIMATSTVLVEREGQRDTCDDARTAGIALLPLLGASVVTVIGSADGTLDVSWSRGIRTRILDSWQDFESYTIRHGARVYVV